MLCKVHFENERSKFSVLQQKLSSYNAYERICLTEEVSMAVYIILSLSWTVPRIKWKSLTLKWRSCCWHRWNMLQCNCLSECKENRTCYVALWIKFYNLILCVRTKFGASIGVSVRRQLGTYMIIIDCQALIEMAAYSSITVNVLQLTHKLPRGWLPPIPLQSSYRCQFPLCSCHYSMGPV